MMIQWNKLVKFDYDTWFAISKFLYFNQRILTEKLIQTKLPVIMTLVQKLHKTCQRHDRWSLSALLPFCVCAGN